MGIPRAFARFLLRQHKQRPFSGSVLQLGRNFVFFGWRELEEMALAEGVELTRSESTRLSNHPRLAAAGYIDDRTFFRALGFSEVHAVDLSAWEGADLLADLNREAPAELQGRFDLVFDSGTIAHIFDVSSTLGNIARMTRVGGRVVLCEPSSNHVDLGFHMFSPTLFSDYFGENRFQLDEIWLMEIRGAWYRGVFTTDPCPAWRYRPGVFDALRFGGIGGKQLENLVAVTRTGESTCDRVPIQGWYRDFYKHLHSQLATGGDAATRPELEERRLGDAAEAAREDPDEPSWSRVDRMLARLKRWRRRVTRHLPPRLGRPDVWF